MLKNRICILFFRPRTFLQFFDLYFVCSKAKHCRNVLGRILGRRNKIQYPSFIVEVISAQQVWPKSFLIWTKLSLLITSQASNLSGLSPFILKEKHFLTFLSLFSVSLSILYLSLLTQKWCSHTPYWSVLDFWKINNQFGKIKFDELGFSLFQTGFLLTV